MITCCLNSSPDYGSTQSTGTSSTPSVKQARQKWHRHHHHHHRTATIRDHQSASFDDDQLPPWMTAANSSPRSSLRRHNSRTSSTSSIRIPSSPAAPSRQPIIQQLQPQQPQQQQQHQKQPLLNFFIKRSASAILSVEAATASSSSSSSTARGRSRTCQWRDDPPRPRASYGSGLHLGSSVTFCNTLGRGPPPPGTGVFPHYNEDDMSPGRLRRSCSITLAYPSESVLHTTASAAATTTTVTSTGNQHSTTVDINHFGQVYSQ